MNECVHVSHAPLSRSCNFFVGSGPRTASMVSFTTQCSSSAERPGLIASGPRTRGRRCRRPRPRGCLRAWGSWHGMRPSPPCSAKSELLSRRQGGWKNDGTGHTNAPSSQEHSQRSDSQHRLTQPSLPLAHLLGLRHADGSVASVSDAQPRVPSSA